jgi:hypothetical protein
MTTAELVDFLRLPAGSCVDVETRNRHYRIECLGGTAILVSGHPEYCPTPVVGRMLEHGPLQCGKSLQFMLDHRPVTTSRIVKLRVERAPVSSSVH